MPTYDYECKKCGHRFEVFQSMSEDPLTTCPECGGNVRRLIGGGAGIIFKGSGFYATDSRKSTAATVPSKSESSSESTGKDASGGDGKKGDSSAVAAKSETSTVSSGANGKDS